MCNLAIIYCSTFLLVLCMYHENKQMKINLDENEVLDSCVASLTKNWCGLFPYSLGGFVLDLVMTWY